MTSTTPKNIYLIGPMGAGKTSIGRQLARKLGLTFYDSDEVIEERTGADIPWIYDLEGEAGFQQREAKVIAELTQLTGILLATGGGTIAIPANQKALIETGIIIYLKTSLDDQMERIKRSKKRPLTKENAKRREFLTVLRAKRQPIYAACANISYDTDKKTLHLVVDELLKILRKKYQIKPLLK